MMELPGKLIAWRAQAADPAGELPLPFRAMRDHWGDSTVPVGWVMLAGAVLVVLLAAIWFWGWWKQRHERARPWWVFYCTARHMGLTWREQWLLVRIARHARLASPLTLMLSRRTLGHHAKQYLQHRAQHRRGAVVPRLVAIRQALFEPVAPEPAGPGAAVSGRERPGPA